jgi:5'-nucleotidase / UDP-sugar diphosphatase
MPGGDRCRTDIAAGNFTYEDAYNLLPFSNTLVLLEMNGSDIKLVLEQALESSFTGGSSGSYPYAAGLRYDVDANGDLGKRISNLEYNIRLAAGEWSAIDLMGIYSVVTNDFIAAGLDGYTVFAAVKDVVDTQTAYAQTFIDYAIDKGTLLDPPLDTYSTKSFISLKMMEDDDGDDTPSTGPVAGASSASGSVIWKMLPLMTIMATVIGFTG